jgi:hypothetical protein
VVRWQFPAGAVIGDFEIMGDPQIPAEHLGAIPALEANDVILLYRASNRNRRHQRFLQADAGPWDLKLDTSPTA